MMENACFFVHEGKLPAPLPAPVLVPCKSRIEVPSIFIDGKNQSSVLAGKYGEGL
jgi:hypothetical protein